MAQLKFDDDKLSGPVAWSQLALRLVVAAIFMAHGAQKVFGLFGGQGLESTMQSTPGGPIIGFLVAIGECFGGLGILVGLLSRFSALANIVIMVGAIATVTGKNGFFLPQKGFEYNLALIGLLIPLLIVGPGKFTVLRLIHLRIPSALE